jgi:DNA-binding response OmpR family regulator
MSDTIERVLIVEDERGLADNYAEILDREYTVKTVYDGETALSVVDETVDAILLDRRMPGLSGGEVLSQLRDRGYDGPVTMLTAVKPDWDIVEMGFDDYLLKPIGMTELTEAVERLAVFATVDWTVRQHVRQTVTQAALEGQKGQIDDDRLDGLQRAAAESASELDDVTSELSPAETELIVKTITRNLGGNE